MACFINSRSTVSSNGSSIVNSQRSETTSVNEEHDSSNNNTNTTMLGIVSQKRNIKSVYILKEVIGQGSWGVVRKCQHRVTKQWCACKTINKGKVPSTEDILEQEVTNLHRVKGHPHLLELMDVFEDKKNLHIVTELLHGGELYEQVLALAKTPQKTFSPQDAAWIIRNSLDAIRYMHQLGVVHRDLKASNFLFAEPNNAQSIKIIDLGLSHYYRKNSQSMENELECNDDEQLITGCVGTVYYVAPEVLTSDEKGYTNKIDVWSIGVIAYLVLSASLPFHGLDERATAKLLMSDTVQVEFPDSKWKDVDPLAIDFCKTLLQKNPTQRPSARQAMCHPWILKHCHEPPCSSLKSSPLRITEKTLDDDLQSSPTCTTILIGEESLSLRSKSCEFSSGPQRDVASERKVREELDSITGLFRRMFTR